MKRRYDVGTDLKPAPPLLSFKEGKLNSPGPNLAPCMSTPSEDALKEVIRDIQYISGKKVSPIVAIEALLHYWILETKRRSRTEVALQLNAGRLLAHKRRATKQKDEKEGYEAIAERLLAALH